MASDTDPPARPRRERPLVAPGREQPAPEPDVPVEDAVVDYEAEFDEPFTASTPPSGPPVIEFPEVMADQRDDHVEVSFDGPTLQQRWTIAVRIFLAIPHLIVFYIVSQVLQLVGVIAWFAALFTRRVPKGIADFIGQGIEYQARVVGYAMFLLTDKYPPFSFDGTPYAVNVRVQTGEFSRAAVFFRLVLAVPAFIVSGLASYGAMLVMPVGWLLALLVGRLPTPLWEANAAVLRYNTRSYAYFFLATAEYPAALYGDKPGFDAPVAGVVPDLPDVPRITRLVLSRSAKVLVSFFIGSAVLLYVGMFVAIIATLPSTGTYEELLDDGDVLYASIEDFGRQSQICALNGGLPCLREANQDLAQAFDTFALEVDALDSSAPSEPNVILGAQRCASALRSVAASESEASYRAALDAYEDAFNDFSIDLEALESEVFFG